MKDSPFHRVSTQEPGVAFEAVFDLPNDGTSVNQIVFHVEMESFDSPNCEVSIRTRTFKDTLLIVTILPVSSLGNVLYNFAQVKMVPVLVFK